MKARDVKLIILALIGFGIVFGLLDAILFAGAVAYLFMPVVNYIDRKVNNRTFAAGAVFIFAGVLALAPVFALVNFVVNNRLEIGSFVSVVASSLGAVIDSGRTAEFGGAFAAILVERLAQGIGSLVVNTPAALVSLFVFFAVLFYFLRDGPKLKKYVYSLGKKTKTAHLFRNIEKLTEGVLYGFVMVAIIKGFLVYIVFRLLGLEFALLLALAIAIMALVPMLGSYLVYIPLVVVNFLMGNVLGAAIIGIYALISEVFFFFYLQPKLMSRRTAIHPALMMIGVLGGVFFIGSIGIVVGPIALGALKIVVDDYHL